MPGYLVERGNQELNRHNRGKNYFRYGTTKGNAKKMFVRRVASLVLVAAFAMLSAAAARAATPPAGVLTVVNGLFAAANADNGWQVARYFSADAVITDDAAPPFVWTGADAVLHWWNKVDNDLATMHGAHLHLTMRPIKHCYVVGGRAFVVAPFQMALTASGKTQDVDGLSTMTLRRTGGTWKITTASFGDE